MDYFKKYHPLLLKVDLRTNLRT